MDRHLHGGDAKCVKFGNRVIEATGAVSDHCHPNVLRLEIHRTPLERAIQAVLSFLPAVLTSWAQAKYPEWTLPERFVLKVQKDGWEEQFDSEMAAYEKLRPIQGVGVPKCYGQAAYGGTRALVLSDIGGNCIATPEGTVLDVKDFQSLIYQALKTLTDLGVSHDDTKLDNFHLVTEDGKDRIMVVDLEMVDVHLSEEDFAYIARSKATWLTRQYRSHLECMEFDGVLLPKRPLNA
ncbi:hypothetical protein ACJ41O_006757 [Fusarium nematophilum]